MAKQSLLGLLKRLKALIKRLTTHYPVIYNANSADEPSYNKRALFIYVIKPFLQEGASRLLAHQNARQCKQIAALLGEFGYIVDVVDVNKKGFKPSKDYELILSNKVTNVFFNKDAVKIYLATTFCHPGHRRNLLRRHALLFKRRNYTIETRRLYSGEMPYVTQADAIICFG